MKNWTEEALENSLKKIERNIEGIGEHFPHVAYDGIYNDQGPYFWVSGFWPGLLWLLYEETGKKEALKLSRKLEEDLDEVLDGFMTVHHDAGFMWLPSAVIDYKLTGNEASRVRGLKAASHLAGRFNPAGCFIRAWNDEVKPDSQGWTIIDSMMNLSLLFWASREYKDPRFRHIAAAHADTVLRHFIRPDNTLAHIVSFDPETGEKMENLGGQGQDGNSAWARGQAWAIYGMAIAYRETGKESYLNACKNVAAYFLSHLREDKAPVWDFRASKDSRWALDTSASACAASGLLELYSLMEDGPDRDFYYEQALAVLKGLYDSYFDHRQESQSMIQMGTVHFPAGKNINVPIIYGDFFFTEALIKLKHKTNIF